MRGAAAVQLPTEDEIMNRLAEPAPSLADFERAAALRRLLDDGIHAGEARAIRASAVFERIEPGYHFRLFDRPRDPR